MSNFINALRTPAPGVLAVLALACFGLVACGGSSGSSTNAATTTARATTTGNTPTSTSSTSTQAKGSATPRFVAIRECLQKNGVTFPKHASGPNGPAGGAGSFLRPGGAGRELPKGVTRAQFAAALKKCGGANFAPGAGSAKAGGALRGPSASLFRAALAKYAECLRQNGVNLPAPNSSGKGPIFNTKGLNPGSPQFRAATMKCRGTLLGAFRRKP